MKAPLLVVPTLRIFRVSVNPFITNTPWNSSSPVAPMLTLLLRSKLTSIARNVPKTRLHFSTATTVQKKLQNGSQVSRFDSKQTPRIVIGTTKSWVTCTLDPKFKMTSSWSRRTAIRPTTLPTLLMMPRWVLPMSCVELNICLAHPITSLYMKHLV